MASNLVNTSQTKTSFSNFNIGSAKRDPARQNSLCSAMNLLNLCKGGGKQNDLILFDFSKKKMKRLRMKNFFINYTTMASGMGILKWIYDFLDNRK